MYEGVDLWDTNKLSTDAMALKIEELNISFNIYSPRW